ncbi:tetratricopeptide repeat protein [Novosphingobium sp. FSY-8]|uniref:Tetratricopeptide repeat protein n=1 Tax=Novosphingobium ovatum TaxID=1908523 RepID=A0ABW9XF01_9SPHN|nr:putative 2OG-Fe(II) oxygenase [Novosphingobium ovatum]NBC37122.1 tetratricopeptide repeat protein [Novosphingobium ovatum]
MSPQVQAALDRARAARSAQDMAGADAAITQAAALAPDDRLVAFLLAQLRFERGLAAAELFTRAAALWPDNRDVTRNHALALAAEGQVAAAIALLADAVRRTPDWLDGHRVLASLRWVMGDRAGFDADLARAARGAVGHAGLWLGWFAVVVQTRDWARARAILDECAPALGTHAGHVQARLFVAGETGDLAAETALLAQTAGRQDAFLMIARIRHHLRGGDAAAALAIALSLAQAGGAFAGQVWPYVSTCWRLLGDARAGWLDGDPAFVRAMDVGLTGAELNELADVLRGLHQAQLPYAEQSVRGGTQTDRSVLLRHEPVIERTRAALMACVADYVAALPPLDPAHPLLSRPRGALRISGSWSVRLEGGGFNVTHSHPMGWISSAFYVSLPDAAQMGAAPAGHFHYGAPPPELGLDLAPYATIAPRVGQLVLFPSTLWHGTVPTLGGERLNIAFDVVGAG